MPAWGRRQEREADLLGIDLLVKAGYSPVAMMTMLEKYRAWEAKTKEADDAFWSRAPDVSKTNVTEAAKMTINRLVGELSASHPDTGKRLEDVATYIDRHYGELNLPEPKTAAWNDVKRIPDVREITRNYDLAFSARKLLERGKAADAYAMPRPRRPAAPPPTPTPTGSSPNRPWGRGAQRGRGGPRSRHQGQ